MSSSSLSVSSSSSLSSSLQRWKEWETRRRHVVQRAVLICTSHSQAWHDLLVQESLPELQEAAALLHAMGMAQQVVADILDEPLLGSVVSPQKEHDLINDSTESGMSGLESDQPSDSASLLSSPPSDDFNTASAHPYLLDWNWLDSSSKDTSMMSTTTIGSSFSGSNSKNHDPSSAGNPSPRQVTHFNSSQKQQQQQQDKAESSSSSSMLDFDRSPLSWVRAPSKQSKHDSSDKSTSGHSASSKPQSKDKSKSADNDDHDDDDDATSTASSSESHSSLLGLWQEDERVTQVDFAQTARMLQTDLAITKLQPWYTNMRSMAHQLDVQGPIWIQTMNDAEHVIQQAWDAYFSVASRVHRFSAYQDMFSGMGIATRGGSARAAGRGRPWVAATDHPCANTTDTPREQTSDMWCLELTYRMALSQQGKIAQQAYQQFQSLFQALHAVEVLRRMKIRDYLYRGMQRQQAVWARAGGDRQVEFLSHLTDTDMDRTFVEEQVAAAIADKMSQSKYSDTMAASTLTHKDGSHEAWSVSSFLPLPNPLRATTAAASASQLSPLTMMSNSWLDLSSCDRDDTEYSLDSDIGDSLNHFSRYDARGFPEEKKQGDDEDDNNNKDSSSSSRSHHKDFAKKNKCHRELKEWQDLSQWVETRLSPANLLDSDHVLFAAVVEWFDLPSLPETTSSCSTGSRLAIGTTSALNALGGSALLMGRSAGRDVDPSTEVDPPPKALDGSSVVLAVITEDGWLYLFDLPQEKVHQYQQQQQQEKQAQKDRIHKQQKQRRYRGRFRETSREMETPVGAGCMTEQQALELLLIRSDLPSNSSPSLSCDFPSTTTSSSVVGIVMPSNKFRLDDYMVDMSQHDLAVELYPKKKKIRPSRQLRYPSGNAASSSPPSSSSWSSSRGGLMSSWLDMKHHVEQEQREHEQRRIYLRVASPHDQIALISAIHGDMTGMEV